MEKVFHLIILMSAVITLTALTSSLAQQSYCQQYFGDSICDDSKQDCGPAYVEPTDPNNPASGSILECNECQTGGYDCSKSLPKEGPDSPLCKAYYGDNICDDKKEKCDNDYKQGISLDSCQECSTGGFVCATVSKPATGPESSLCQTYGLPSDPYCDDAKENCVSGYVEGISEPSCQECSTGKWKDCKTKAGQKDFKMAFILLVKSPTDATSERIARLNQIKDAFSESFKIATRNLATMDTSSDIEIITVDSDYNTVSFDYIKYTKNFYENNEDGFDFISFYTTFPVESYQAHLPTKNDIKGIGIEIFDQKELYGSQSKLKGINFIGDITIFEKYQSVTVENSLNALKHETGHQWCCYIMDSREEGGAVPLIQQYIHWSFFLDLESINNNYNDPLGHTGIWVETEKNKFTLQLSKYTETRYSPLTLYLMGLLPSEEVPPIPLIRPFDSTIEKSTISSNEVEGTKTFVTIEDIIAREGKWECCFKP